MRNALHVVVAMMLVAGVGCGGEGGRRELVVFAAASLTDAFAALASAYESAHPDVVVALNLAGSATLLTQLQEGAPADVFAPADPATMDRLRAGVATSPPVIVARNSLTIAVPEGNPLGIESLQDLADPALLIGLCAPSVPCGALADMTLAAAGVIPSIDTREPSVRALLAKIASGELDAGIVYVTDVLAAEDAVDAVAIPSAVNVATEYPVAMLAASSSGNDAASFVDFLQSDEARSIFRRFGFEVP